MSWLFIEPDLTRWQNVRLRFWLLGMDLFHWLRAGRLYLFCVERAGGLTYGSSPKESES